MPNQAQIDRALSLYNEVERAVATKANLGKRLEFISLASSVLTSGSLWLLLSEAIPRPVLWFGALASTLTTGITIYVGTTNLNRYRSRALGLLKRASKFLAKVRSKELRDNEFWDNYKFIEVTLRDIQHGRNDAETEVA